jgi:hypothetical protein
MAKHELHLGVRDDSGVVVGAECTECGKVVMYENGKIPLDIRTQECKPAAGQDLKK